MDDIMMMKKHTCRSNDSSPASSPLAMHKSSQTISKTKPKIRIIHIFAPEIIKTDVENFRELVQRLTGKPSDDSEKGCNMKKPRVVAGGRRNHHQESITKGSTSSVHGYDDQMYNSGYKPNYMTKKMDLRNGFWGLEPIRERVVKEEAERVWNGDQNSGGFSGGFLGGFADFEGCFISELGELPLLPLDIATHHMHGFGETQLS
ncbi:putative VQ motif-containing protein [Quillaja saponaria]|uniref:VQ motif-containing protein n=1 Tax=Quillaja saponaria TaxID=32244 RepID=A0AAD7PYC9_QUISA|nr:putative VQ motif-containing protein [Quillaja saponaria]